jgi:hypothetical protein
VVPLSYHDFFAGCATVSGALIGLLFVAISVSPEKLAGDTASADHQVKAGAAFSALINTLVIALVALLPATNLGPASIALAAAGLASTTGLIILLWREHKEKIRPRQVGLLVVLIVLYGLQLANAVRLDGSPRDVNAVDNQAVLAIVFFLFAIARAWQLVGARDTSLLSTVADLAQRQVRLHPHLADDDQAHKADPASGHDDGG